MASHKSASFPHFGTDAIHAGQSPDKWNSKAVIPPITLSATFKQETPGGVESGYEYGRGGNPTRDCFEECMAKLEGGKYGLAFSSGLATLSAVTLMLSSGDHVVCMDDSYGGTNRLLRKLLSKKNVETSFVNCCILEKVEKAIIPDRTKLVWIETPTNPTMKVVDIEGVCKIAHKHKGVIVVVDNTFMSPYCQRPLSLGADVVMHSVTKYINGHTDVVMGVAVTSDEEIHKELRFNQYAAGFVPSPFDCYLANRGLKTLHVRMRQHCANATAVNEFLEGNPRVAKVSFPGSPNHPQYELVKKQCKSVSGMLSFEIQGTVEHARKFIQSLKVFTLAESLGGFESLAEVPGLMTHLSVPPEMRKELGITDTLIRLSVGLEEIEDLIEDLDQALKKAISDEELKKLN